MADPLASSYNRNPTGKNQYSPCATIDDPLLVDALGKYHREKLDNNMLISQRLKADYGIEMGASTVKRRRRALGFLGSRSTMKTIDLARAKQLIIAHMDADSLKPACARSIQHRIAYEESIHLPRDFITKVICAHSDQEKSETRESASKQVDRGSKRPARPSMTSGEARKMPGSNRSSSPRALPCADATCRVVVAAKGADGCKKRRRGDTPLQERSGGAT